MEKDKLNPPSRKYITLLGGVCIYLCTGQVYTWGTISAYITQYFNRIQNTNLTPDEVNIVFSLQVMALFIGNLFGVPLQKRIGSRKTAFVSCIGNTSSLFFAGLSKTFYGFLLFYSIGTGFFCGLPYVPALSICYNYFPRKKGLIAGVCTMAFGFSSIFLNVLIQFTMNPDNLPKDPDGHFPESVISKIPLTLHLIALYTFILQLIGALLLKNKKTSLILEDPEDLDEPLQIQKSDQQIQYYKQPFFYLSIALFSLTVSHGYAILSNYKRVGYNLDDKYLTLVVGNLAAFANGGFRLVIGFCYDHLGFSTLYNIICIVNIILGCTWYLINDNETIFAICVFLGAAVEGGHFSIFPTMIVQYYGMTLGPLVYTRVLGSMLIGNFTQQGLFLWFGDSIGNRDVFYVLAGFSVVGLLLNVFVMSKYRKNSEKKYSVLSSEKLLDN